MLIGQIEPTAFHIFGIGIQWYAIIIVLGICLGVALASREAPRVHLRSDDIIDFLLWALPISVIGARLYFVLFNLSDYLANPLEIVMIRHGGLAIYGGLIAGGITLLVFCYHRAISPWKFLDVIAPSVLLGQAIGRWGNFVNHEAYGPETTWTFLKSLHLPDFIVQNMLIDGTYRQPTFLYESIWCFIGVLLLLGLRHRKNLFRVGELFLCYIAWYSFERFFVEGLRTDSLMLGSLRVSQVLSGVLFLGAIGLLIYRRFKVKPDYYYKVKEDVSL